jgi:hypothetical protein
MVKAGGTGRDHIGKKGRPSSISTATDSASEAIKNETEPKLGRGNLRPSDAKRDNPWGKLPGKSTLHYLTDRFFS